MWATVAILLHGCVDKKLVTRCPPGSCPDGTCDADISCGTSNACPHGAAVDACTLGSSDACPSGTACDRDGGVCDLPKVTSIEADDLITGFAAREFELGDDPEVSGGLPSGAPTARRFALTVPADAARVICGLLTCRPTFDYAEGPGQSRLARMANAERCLQRQQIFNVQASGGLQKFTFTVADLEPRTGGSCGKALGLSNVEEPPSDYPVVELLRLGCWAENGTRVIAATRLEPVAVRDLPDNGGVLRTDCLEAQDSSYCRLAGDLGVCDAGECDFDSVPGAAAPLPDGGMGGAPDLLQGEPPPPVTNCRGVSNGATCTRVEVKQAGQCLSGRCIKTTDGESPKPLVVQTCAAEGVSTEWLNCHPSPVLGFGTCFSGACSLRCRKPDDCTEALTDARVPDDETNPKLCYRPPGSYLGVCVAKLPPP